MLQRFLAILLMLAVPVQGFAVPHSHGSMAGTQPDGHNQRPHFHLGGHHHHGHHHGHGHGHSHEDGHAHDPCPCDNSGNEQDASTPEVPTRPSNHDDDALYVSGEFGLNLTQTVQMVADTGLVIWIEADQPTAIGARSYVDAVPCFLARGDTPIYLTTLSLRL